MHEYGTYFNKVTNVQGKTAACIFVVLLKMKAEGFFENISSQ